MKNLSLIIALLLMIGSQAGAECGNLCDRDWWATATEADVQAELDGGADVTARNEYGHTPLLWAAELGTPAIIQALLAAGADVMARYKYDDHTPLHAAIFADDAEEKVKILLDAGADIRAKDKYDITPWDNAQKNDLLKGTKGYWALSDAQYN